METLRSTGRLIIYDVIMKNSGKVCGVSSLACKIKVLNGRIRELENGQFVKLGWIRKYKTQH